MGKYMSERKIEVLDPKARESRVTRESWEVYACDL